MLRRCRSDVIRFAHSDVLRRCAKWCDVFLHTREAHITRWSRHHARSAHHVPLAEHIVPKTKKQSIGLLSFLVAGVGFLCPPPNHSRCAVQSQIASSSPWFGGFGCAKTLHRSLFACLPTPSAASGRRSRIGSNPAHAKRKNTPRGCVFLFGCGGGIWTSRPPGYEPDELPSCSTPRYKIVHKFGRRKWCRKPGSNRYEKKISRDFKSRASANSAIPAYRLPCCHIIIS